MSNDNRNELADVSLLSSADPGFWLCLIRCESCNNTWVIDDFASDVEMQLAAECHECFTNENAPREARV